MNSVMSLEKFAICDMSDIVSDHVGECPFTQGSGFVVKRCKLCTCSTSVGTGDAATATYTVRAHFVQKMDMREDPEWKLYCVYVSSDRVFLGWDTNCLHSISIPNYVCELDEQCFWKCDTLRRVTFGVLSNLERIGAEAFSGTSLNEIDIPDSVREVGDRCFYQCIRLKRVTFGVLSKLEKISGQAFAYAAIRRIHIPDCVSKLCDRCFYWCLRLESMIFGVSSSLAFIEFQSVSATGMVDLYLPNEHVTVFEKAFSDPHDPRRIIL